MAPCGWPRGRAGAGSDERFVDLVFSAFDAGLGDRVILSHDRGWYDPA